MNESEHELIGDFLGGEGSTFEKVNRFMELMTRYDCAIREVRTKFEVLNEELSYKAGRNPIESITSRVKKTRIHRRQAQTAGKADHDRGDLRISERRGGHPCDLSVYRRHL